LANVTRVAEPASALHVLRPRPAAVASLLLSSALAERQSRAG